MGIPGRMTARGNILDGEAGATIRGAMVAHRMATFAAVKGKERRDRHRGGGRDCDHCPDCAEGMCTGDNRTVTKAKDYDCVDCPDQQIA